jgi:membrane protease YdiL (CAAX protease family)
MTNISSDGSKVQAYSFLLLILIFLLNDLANIFVHHYIWWLIIDYIFVKFIPICLIFILIRRQYAEFSDFGLKGLGVKPFILYAILLSTTGIFIDQVVWRFFMKILPNTQLGTWPKIKNPIIDKMDLFFGLILVGFIEEVIFRGFCINILRRLFSKGWVIFIISSLIFGFIHWSLGLHAIVTTALWGILPLWVMWKTGSIAPAILAHILTNVVAFSGIIPSHWFKFLA